jgi:protein-disulfide isomerase
MSKRQEIRERRRKQEQQKKMITLGAIILGAGLIAAVLIYSGISANQQFGSRYMAQDNAMGDPDAPIKIVEYSDYHCGHCGAFAMETEPLLVKDYIENGIVYFVYRSVSGMIGGPESALAAEASYCAGEQNMFWEMHDLIFAHQTSPFNEDNLLQWAKTAGVDLDQYTACMENDTFVSRVEQDEADATAAGVSGTPSFIVSYEVNGEAVEQMLPGNYPYEAFQQIIGEALLEMGLE